MGDNSLTSLIILLFLFIILPAVLKLLGRYTLNSKGDGGEDAEGRRESQIPEGPSPGFPDEGSPGTGSSGENERPAISNKPITPKWF